MNSSNSDKHGNGMYGSAASINGSLCHVSKQHNGLIHYYLNGRRRRIPSVVSAHVNDSLWTNNSRRRERPMASKYSTAAFVGKTMCGNEISTACLYAALLWQQHLMWQPSEEEEEGESPCLK